MNAQLLRLKEDHAIARGLAQHIITTMRELTAVGGEYTARDLALIVQYAGLGAAATLTPTLAPDAFSRLNHSALDLVMDAPREDLT